MADSLPSINFGFDDLRARMAAFTDHFDTFIAQGRQRVLTERNEHRKRLAELEGSFPISISLFLFPNPPTVSA